MGENRMTCIFCQIVEGQIPAKIVLDEPELLAFRDVNPVAPTHVLIIPRKHIASLAEITDAEVALIGRMFVAARKIAEMDGVVARGFRTVFNSGLDAGQTVFHLHLHVLAGRHMHWPPG
jgi:histidine triad (HIT) family protein